MYMRKIFVGMVLCLCVANTVCAQIPDGRGNFIVPCIVVNGDTMPFLQLPEFEIVSKQIFTSKRAQERYRRLVYNVRKVYPYAKFAGEKYQYYNDLLAKEKNNRRRAQLMKQAEKDIKKQFEKELMNLTFSQGKILIKLVDRETSSSAFALVKDLRNGFQAYLYQGIGRLFGYNLKTKYSPHDADRDIENIVKRIERGDLQPIAIAN